MLAHLLISSRGPDFLMLSKRVAASENEIEGICVVRDVITWHTRMRQSCLISSCNIYIFYSLHQGCPRGRCVQLQCWILLLEQHFSYPCTLTLQSMLKTSPLPSKACLIYLNRTVSALEWHVSHAAQSQYCTAVSFWPDIRRIQIE